MGLHFYPRLVDVSPDHPLPEKLEEFPERFALQKPLKDWVVEGPFRDEDAAVYYFMVRCPSLSIREQVDISEDDFFLSPKAVENWISKVVQTVMHGELGGGVMQRLMGKSNEEVKESGSDEMVTVEDYSRGTGSVHRRSLSRESDDDSPENKGGLILPP
jgi:hypothetical protein